MPQICVIVPVYKVEPYINHCIGSIFAQTYTDYELILVDDGSPDRCGEICEEYAATDTRVIVIHQKNGGLSCARNTGIDLTTACISSKWISFIDSDDWVHEEYLAELLLMCKKYHTQCSVIGYSSISEEGLPSCAETLDVQELYIKPDDVYGLRNIVQAWGKLYHIELFRNVRYPVGRINEDRFTTHKLLFQCDYIAVSNKVLYYYYLSPNSITRSKWSPQKMDDLDACEEQLVFFRKHKCVNAYKSTVSQYLSLALHQSDIVKNDDDIDKTYCKVLFNREKRAFRIYRKINKCNVDTHYYIYKRLYPGYVKFYNYRTALKHKLKEGGLLSLFKGRRIE